jgi:hypothetical protein
MSRWDNATLAADCVLAGAQRYQGESFPCGDLTIREACIDAIELDVVRLESLRLDYCQIGRLELSEDHPHGLEVTSCLIGRLIGAARPEGLPGWIRDCDIGEFDDTQTNAAILKLKAPMPSRVLLTVLRKLFLQRGSGRKESALYRGLPQEARQFVDPVLRLLARHGLVFAAGERTATVWHGVRGASERALTIVASAAKGSDPILDEIRGLEQR